MQLDPRTRGTQAAGTGTLQGVESSGSREWAFDVCGKTAAVICYPSFMY